MQAGSSQFSNYNQHTCFVLLLFLSEKFLHTTGMLQNSGLNTVAALTYQET